MLIISRCSILAVISSSSTWRFLKRPASLARVVKINHHSLFNPLSLDCIFFNITIMVGLSNDPLATYAIDAGISKTPASVPRYINRHYNVIVIGLGHRGYQTFVHNLVDSRSISIVAACDVDAGRREFVSGKHPKIPIYGSLEKLLRQHTPDFAIVSVPHRFHADCILALGQAGIPILKEKPASTSLAEYNQLVDLKVRMGVTYQKRFEPRYIHLKNLLSLVGDVVSIRATIAVNCMQPDDADWRVMDDVGVAVRFINLFIHWSSVLLTQNRKTWAAICWTCSFGCSVNPHL